MATRDALKLAEEAGVDLVKIAPTAKPPVCKIVDYGKFKYEQTRKEKEARKKQKVIEIKEIRLSPNIDTNDLNTKVNAARKFITKGDRVKVTLRFRGREMTHMNNSKHILELKEKLGEGVVVLASAKEGKVNLMAMATDAALQKGAHAGNLIKGIAGLVGGGGGGRPNMAQAGGKNPEGIPAAIAEAAKVLDGQLKE